MGYPCCEDRPPRVSGNWTLTFAQLTRNDGGPDVTCANIEKITQSATYSLSIAQCGHPLDSFAIISVTTGPIGGPLTPGEQLIGIFSRNQNGTYALKVPSSTVDNAVFTLNFRELACVKSFSLDYVKTRPGSTVVGSGRGCKY
jgi:hypothetical protein